MMAMPTHAEAEYELSNCGNCPVVAVGRTAQGTPEMGRMRVEQASQSPDHEKRIQAAISGIANGLYKSYSAAAKANGVNSI